MPHELAGVLVGKSLAICQTYGNMGLFLGHAGFLALQHADGFIGMFFWGNQLKIIRRFCIVSGGPKIFLHSNPSFVPQHFRDSRYANLVWQNFRRISLLPLSKMVAWGCLLKQTFVRMEKRPIRPASPHHDLKPLHSKHFSMRALPSMQSCAFQSMFGCATTIDPQCE